MRAATELLAGQPGVRHAILLTDGRNESEAPEDLQAALDRATGVFQCDCRGVGADWEVAELRRIATALLGTVDIVADPTHLADDFEAMMRQAMGKSLADVAVRVWTPQGAEVSFFKQVAPEITRPDRRPGRPSTTGHGDYPTGAWGDESRDYHLSVRVPPGAVGDEMLAARVSVVVDGQVAGQTLVPVPSGPTRRRCRPTSTGRSRTTPASRSWPKPSRKGSTPAGTATRTRPS